MRLPAQPTGLLIEPTGSAATEYSFAMARQPGVGTSLASFELDVWRGHRNQHFLQIMRAGFWRPYVGALSFYAAVAATMAAAGSSAWRVALVLTIALAHSIGFLMLRARAKDPQKVEQAVVVTNTKLLVTIAALTALSGGLASPVVVCLPILVLPSALVLGLGRTTRILALAVVAFLILLAVVPVEVTGPPLPHPHRECLTIIACVWAMMSVFIFTGRIIAATRAASDAIGQLREERLILALSQLRRLQSVGAKVAHELKNPLAAVKGLVQLVARAADSERSRERLDVVQSEISRMETILHEYLSFARPLEDLTPQSVDVAEVAEDVAAVLAGRADQSRVALAVNGPSVRLQADPRRLKEALLNLVANAIDFTPAGGRVDVEVAHHQGGARVVVRDTGCGITSDDLARVGTSFFTTRETGTGLGVVLARNVVRQHGGTFDLASEPGRGTTVTIQLPGAPPATGAPSIHREPAAEAQHGTGSARR
jgi:two-component system, NtrC family, sensor histidine kinase HydH